MYIADKWKEYRLLDADSGERLEYWNGYILIRPDPQIIWKNERKNPYWNKADGIYRRSSDGGGSWVKKKLPEEWRISYGEMMFTLSPMGFKHTGVFPEQAANWDWFSPLIKNAGKKIKLLNLFAYTGGASVAAALAGAEVCHVDASKGMISKAKKNAELSGVSDKKIRYIADDCIKFTEREIRRGNRYDAVILDPPSFGRGPNGECWKLEDNLDGLLKTVCAVLSDAPLFVLLNSYTAGLSPSATAYALHESVVKKQGGAVECAELGLPVEQSGFFLPCGSSARWSRKT